jgi:NTE family protein
VSTSDPSLAIALGGGGARGIAHIPVLEALDELGVTPRFIAGTSIGGMLGAAYACGISGAEIRAHALDVLGNRRSALRHLLKDGVSGLSAVFDFNPFNAFIVDGERLLDFVLPPGLAPDFRSTQIPVALVATDFYAGTAHVFDTGPLRPAIAATIALPALLSPQKVDGRLMIDGGIVNPVPADLLANRAQVKLAVDVTGSPVVGSREIPPSSELLFGSIQIMQSAMIGATLLKHPVDILIEPEISAFKILDFFKVQEILDASAPAKEDVKRRVEAAFSAAAP